LSIGIEEGDVRPAHGAGEKMNNYKLRKKLTVLCLVAFIFTIVVAAAGIVSAYELNKESERSYNQSFVSLSTLAVMYDTLAQQRICSLDIVLYNGYDEAFVQEERESIVEKHELFDKSFKDFKDDMGTGTGAEEKQLVAHIEEKYYTDFAEAKQRILNVAADAPMADKLAILKDIDGLGADISGAMDELITIQEKDAQKSLEESRDRFWLTLFILLGVTIVSLIIAIILATRISRGVSGPMNRISDLMARVADTGDLNPDEKVYKELERSSGNRDEVGVLSGAFLKMMRDIKNKAGVLEVIATGDLTPRAELASERDTLGISVNKVASNLSGMVAETKASVEQMMAGIGHLDKGAQSLASSSMEQSVTSESLLGQVNNIAEAAEQNADRARTATELTDRVKADAMGGGAQMEKMTGAIHEIADASREVGTVMKAIDDIAFQTNILSLNAAVEAARAGQHGRGFAVVADEVRSLATRSAASARESGELIENTINKTAQGEQIVRETSEFLDNIIEENRACTELIAEMAQVAKDQNEAIREIRTGIAQFARAINQNSATAEESAATSAELTGQTDLLKEMVKRFKVEE
jgi:methyl-accepting chemotaxis protein